MTKWIGKIQNYIRRVFSTNPAESSFGDNQEEAHFSDVVRSLTRVGNEHSGEYIVSVVNGKYSNVELQQWMVRELDQIYRESVTIGIDRVHSVPDSTISEAKVELFRTHFYDQFSEDEISSVLLSIYETESELFRIQSLFESIEVDDHVNFYEIATMSSTPEPTMVAESEQIPRTEYDHETTTVEMMKFWSQLDLVTGHIVAQIQQHIRSRAQRVLDEIHTSSDKIQSLEEAVYEMGDNGLRPDTIVGHGGRSPPEYVWSLLNYPQYVYDGMDVLESDFVLGDTPIGAHVMSQEPTIEKDRRSYESPHRYFLTLRENYVVYDDESVEFANRYN